jgi:hypothetical protein
MNIGAWIPQLFYDLIGRVIPGAAVTISAFVITYGPEESLRYLTTWSASSANTKLPVVLLLLGSLLLFYLVGTLLGGLWFGLCHSTKFHTKMVKHSVRRSLKGMENVSDDIKINFPRSISYIYDYIHLRAPKTGARIAKLRAEEHMSGVMVIGFIILAIIYGLIPSIRYAEWPYWLIQILLIFIAIVSLVLACHLNWRFGTALCNVWIHLKSGVKEAVL